MPAYSFKERFVPWVKDGSKPNTIRAFRKYRVKVGQLAHLYYGMRTKYCTKLIDPSPVISDVKCILIYAEPDGRQGIYMMDTDWLDKDQRELVKVRKFPEGVNCTKLLRVDCDKMAWQDGFRFNANPDMYRGCFDIMIRFWKQTHELPFVGNFISWKQ